MNPSLASLWQQNLIGLKADVYRYWLPRRAGAIQVISDVPMSGIAGVQSTSAKPAPAQTAKAKA